MNKDATAPEAPPSYQETMGQQPYPHASAGAGGFVPGAVPPPSMPPPQDPTKGMAPGYVPGSAAPPPPPGYLPPPQGGQMGPPPPQQQRIVVVVNQPNFGPRPVDMMCPHCQCQIRTTTESEPGVMAWILAGVLCVVGLWPCACIPCCIDTLNSVTHKCPNCKHFLGRYKGGM